MVKKRPPAQSSRWAPRDVFASDERLVALAGHHELRDRTCHTATPRRGERQIGRFSIGTRWANHKYPPGSLSAERMSTGGRTRNGEETPTGSIEPVGATRRLRQ